MGSASAAGVGHGRLSQLAPEKPHLPDVVGIVLHQKGDEPELRGIPHRETVDVGPAQLFGRPAAHNVAELAADREPPLALLGERRPLDDVLDAAGLGEIARQWIGQRMAEPVDEEVTRIGQMRREERDGVGKECIKLCGSTV